MNSSLRQGFYRYGFYPIRLPANSLKLLVRLFPYRDAAGYGGSDAFNASARNSSDTHVVLTSQQMLFGRKAAPAVDPG
jgi:hypothetical protein